MKADAQKNALDLIAHIRAGEKSKYFSIEMPDEKMKACGMGGMFRT